MIHDFFQTCLKIPAAFKDRWPFLFRCLFYTSMAGFISGCALGYLHVKGWVSHAEDGLILYAATFGIGAVLSTSFVLYQVRQNQLKAERVKKPGRPGSSRD